jgi:hypothetical protein
MTPPRQAFRQPTFEELRRASTHDAGRPPWASEEQWAQIQEQAREREERRRYIESLRGAGPGVNREPEADPFEIAVAREEQVIRGRRYKDRIREVAEARLAAESPVKATNFKKIGAKKPPAYLERTDGVCLFYAGKDHAVYGQTESGKDMLLVALVKDILGLGENRVAWIDFEESDGKETGSRFLNAGLGIGLLSDTARFRHYTPGKKEDALSVLASVVAWQPCFTILNGVTAAYQLFGWRIKEGDDAAEYRRVIVRPLQEAGAGVCSTDHVTLESASGHSGVMRHAYGGVMKLNVSDGASYLLVPSTVIGRRQTGTSQLYITKDRPGMIKPECERQSQKGSDPLVRYAGMLTVKSSGDSPGELDISVVSPLEADEGPARDGNADVPDSLMEKILSDWKQYGEAGISKTSYIKAFKGNGARQVPLAIDVAVANGCLVHGVRSTRGIKLRWGKDWDNAEKIGIGEAGTDA